MIDKIYYKVSDKTVSPWILIKPIIWEEYVSPSFQSYVHLDKNLVVWQSLLSDNEWYRLWLWYYDEHWDAFVEISNNDDYALIIWHPVMIGDVLDFVAEHDKTIPYWLSEEETEIVILRLEKRKPIEDQSDECIDFIYNLIQQWS